MTTPLDESQDVLKAIDSEGLSIVFVDAAATFMLPDSQRPVFRCSAQILTRAEEMHATLYIRHDQPVPKEFVPISIEGTDTLGRQYVLQMSPQKITGGTVLSVFNGPCHVLIGRRIGLPTRETQCVTFRASGDVVVPFSSKTTVTREWKGKLIYQGGDAGGYFGQHDDISIDVDQRHSFTTINVYTKLKNVQAEKIMDAAEGAASYVLGFNLDPFYAFCTGTGEDVVWMHSRGTKPFPGQLPSPLDLRTDADLFSKIFTHFFYYSLNSEGERRSEAHALVFEVYKSFELAYLPHQILIVCVAIENLMRELIKPGDEFKFSESDLTIVTDAITAINLPPTKKTRLTGLMSMLNSASMSFLFRKAIDENLLDSRHKKTWEKWRHSLAHGGKSSEQQAIVDDLFMLLNAFHRLIGRKIGFDFVG